MIKKLRLQNFRGFEDLKLENLSRLNLIVGKNNSGKTSLLEALVLLSDPDRMRDMPDILRATHGNRTLRYFSWIVRDGAGAEAATLSALRRDSLHRTIEIVRGTRDHKDWTPVGDPPVISRKVKHSEVKTTQGLSSQQTVMHDRPKGAYGEVRLHIVPVGDASYERLVHSFALAVKPEADERLIHEIVRYVDPRVSRVRFDPGDIDEDTQHIMVDVGLSEMLPLSQAGHGIQRLLSILSDLIGKRPKVCFVDEIENGIHHSALGDIWKGLAEVCERLDIQLFATTHSHECIEAAHQAMSARDEYDFSVIQLVRQKDGIQGYVRDRKDIEAALAGEIDLR